MIRYVQSITPAVIAALLVVAPASSATSQTPIRLAQNSSGGPNLFSLLQDIQRLQSEVRELRGEVDTLQYQLRQNEQGQRELYQNLDKRLSRLENGGGMGAGNTAGNGSSSDGSSAPPGGDPAVQTAYTAAFDQLKNGEYDAAIGAFRSFLDQHPESAYSDNAWYWLGEAQYVQQDYDASLEAFRTVVNRFGASDKIPGSLYKIGLIQADRGETDNARGTLQRVVDQFPESSVAEMARDRLQRLGG